MKQRVSIEEILELNQDQRESLNNMWMAEINDVAVGFVCRDAEEDIYDAIPFVLGDVFVEQSYGRKFVNITLRSLKSMGMDENISEENFDDNVEDIEEEELIIQSFEPDYFNKYECLPLLSIGQMIKILRDKSYGNGSFYLDIKESTEKSGIGRDITQYISYGKDIEEVEICDALWTAVKEIL